MKLNKYRIYLSTKDLVNRNFVLMELTRTQKRNLEKNHSCIVVHEDFWND